MRWANCPPIPVHFAALHLLTKAPLLHLPRPYASSSVILSVPMFLKRTFILLLYSVLWSGSDKLPTGCIWFPSRSKACLCVWDASPPQGKDTSGQLQVTAALIEIRTALIGCHQSANPSPLPFIFRRFVPRFVSINSSFPPPLFLPGRHLY